MSWEFWSLWLLFVKLGFILMEGLLEQREPGLYLMGRLLFSMVSIPTGWCMLQLSPVRGIRSRTLSGRLLVLAYRCVGLGLLAMEAIERYRYRPVPTMNVSFRYKYSLITSKLMPYCCYHCYLINYKMESDC